MRILLAVCSVLAAGPSYAEMTDPGKMGESLAQSCTSCHGADGRGGEAIPALAGRPAEELFARMQTLSQSKDMTDIMPRILREYKPEELQAIAVWLAGVKP